MSVPVRIAFDVALPFVAAQAFAIEGRPFVADDPVPWRELGISADVLLTWWQAGLVTCTPAPTAIEAPRTKPPQAPPRARR